MGTTQKNAIDKAMDMVRSGEIGADEANAEIVRMMGVRIVSGSIPRDVRSQLNAAVKSGRLGHIKKDGLLPEAYFHPNGRANALEIRERHARSSIESIRRVMC